MLNRYISVAVFVFSLLLSSASSAAIVVAEFNSQAEYSEFYIPVNPMLFADFYVTGDAGEHEQDFNVTEQDTQITTVPVPAAAWLFISGILGFLTVCRRKKEHAKG